MELKLQPFKKKMEIFLTKILHSKLYSKDSTESTINRLNTEYNVHYSLQCTLYNVHTAHLTLEGVYYR